MLPWIEPPQTDVPEELLSAVGGHPLVATILVRRGLSDVWAARAFLEPAQVSPAPPSDLPGLDTAADRIEIAIERREAIFVWGDFDVDGQTATTLLVSMLEDLGARVLYHIPVRAKESHGVNVQVLGEILDTKPEVEVLLTCDTGIAAHQAVDFAQGCGVDVLITDHHELPENLPEALAVVNPNLLPGGHTLGGLPGVGVAYKLAEEMYKRAGIPQDCERHLDLVALGIVADVARQYGDTRFLLQRGLQALRRSQRLGLQVMMEIAELNPALLTEEHIGFQIGPRLNAIGRLGDANPVVEFLTTKDAGRARMLAHQLEGLNSKRKLLTSQVYQGALAQIERDETLLNDAALVLAHPDWHAGVIGIVASKLVERYHKPAVLISTPEDGLGRASARSVEGVDITAAITQGQDLLEGFGGHAMAAGFAIKPENIPAFRRRLSRTVALIGDLPEAGLAIDGYVPLSGLTLDLVTDLERLAPFGPDNPPLVLVSRGVRITNTQVIGRTKEHLRLTVEDQDGAVQRVIWWGGADNRHELPAGIIDLAYNARASTFGGQREVQMEWVGFRWVEGGLPNDERALDIEIIDFRSEVQPLRILSKWPDGEPIQVWAEAGARRELERGRAVNKERFTIRNRLELESSETLVIWTTPPGLGELKAVLERVQPQRVLIFAVDPNMDRFDDFVQRLAGLAKYAIQARSGRTNLEELAAGSAQRALAVRLGLEWLAAQGHLGVEYDDEGEVLLTRCGVGVHQDSGLLTSKLGELLGESAAFRSYFADKNLDALIRGLTNFQ